MVYEDTVPVSFREFLIELVSGKFRKIAYFGCVPCIIISCRFDYAKLREVVANVGGLFPKILSINVAEFL